VTPLLDEDSLKAYTMLRDVMKDVMKPTEDNLTTLNTKMDAITARLDEKYYQKDMIDEKFKAIQDQLTQAKERMWKLLGGAAAGLTILSWAMTHVRF
jgi:uncharacterized protein YpuA (DUF1002 family)